MRATRWVTVISSVVLVAVLAGCGGTTSVTTTVPDDTGRLYGPGEVTLEVDGSIAVILRSNPTTGYEWTATSGDPAVASVDEGSFAAFPTTSLGTGGGGEITFTITAKTVGRTEVVLTEARPWETGVPPVNEVTVSVTVVAAGGGS